MIHIFLILNFIHDIVLVRSPTDSLQYHKQLERQINDINNLKIYNMSLQQEKFNKRKFSPRHLRRRNEPIMNPCTPEHDRADMLNLAVQHEKEAMAREDEFMAQHLRNEGYKVEKKVNL